MVDTRSRNVGALEVRREVKWGDLAKWIPSDAIVVGVERDYASQCMKIFIEHDSFPLVRWGEIVPILVSLPSYKRYA